MAGCTSERLMRLLGLQGLRRGKSVRTITSDSAAPYPLDCVNRLSKASRPNELWVPDFRLPDIGGKRCLTLCRR